MGVARLYMKMGRKLGYWGLAAIFIGLFVISSYITSFSPNAVVSYSTPSVRSQSQASNKGSQFKRNDMKENETLIGKLYNSNKYGHRQINASSNADLFPTSSPFPLSTSTSPLPSLPLFPNTSLTPVTYLSAASNCKENCLLLNTRRKAKALWGGSKSCGDYRVRFAQAYFLPRLALASYPGSGNTWTRNLLEAASGVYTGSIYSDYQLYMYGYNGEMEEWTSGTTIAQKTHDCGPSHIQAFGVAEDGRKGRGGILVLRNPYRAILSFHNFIFGGHTGYAPISNYRRKDWPIFVRLQTKAWLEMAVNWTHHAPRLHVLHYEELRQDPVPRLLETLTFAGLTPDEGRMKCFEKHVSRTFKRKEQLIPEGLEIFSPALRDKIDRAIRYVDYLLQRRQLRPLPTHLYEFYNNTSSDQLKAVPCQPDETKLQCDNRIDGVNMYANKNEKDKRKTKTGEGKSNK